MMNRGANIPLFTRRRLLALGAATSATALFAGQAAAQLKLDITQGNVQPIPIAIPDFNAGTQNDSETARGMTQVITNNLRRSGLFNPSHAVIRPPSE